MHALKLTRPLPSFLHHPRLVVRFRDRRPSKLLSRAHLFLHQRFCARLDPKLSTRLAKRVTNVRHFRRCKLGGYDSALPVDLVKDEVAMEKSVRKTDVPELSGRDSQDDVSCPIALALLVRFPRCKISRKRLNSLIRCFALTLCFCFCFCSSTLHHKSPSRHRRSIPRPQFPIGQRSRRPRNHHGSQEQGREPVHLALLFLAA